MNAPLLQKRKTFTKIYPALPRIKEFDIFDYEKIFSDEKTRKLIREGRTIGCFYIESPGMRALLRKLSCDSFEMLTAASSVIRPGVASSGMMAEFVKRHVNPSARKYLIPEMEKYLGETYGVMIYQEDVIRIAHHVAGLSLEEADLLRRAMSGKMRSEKAMQKIKKRFYDSCAKEGLSGKVTDELWRQIKSFAGYAFSKAHSASFALLSFQMAYLKAHYPAEFIAAVLNNGGGYYSQGVYVNEAKRIGVRVLLPSVNKSLFEYTGHNQTLRLGLKAIKNLSEKTVKDIVRERRTNGEYQSFGDFLKRTKIGFAEVVLLIKSGALDCFGKTRPSLLRLADVHLQYVKFFAGRQYLFNNEAMESKENFETLTQYGLKKICADELEIFGFTVSCHPLNFFEKEAEKYSVVASSEMFRYAGQRIKMLGWFVSSKRLRTGKGEIMKFLSLEDLTGTFEVVIFPEVYNRLARKTFSMGPFLVEGKIDDDNPFNIVAENLEILPFAFRKSAVGKESTREESNNRKITTAETVTVKLGKRKIKSAIL